MCHWRRCTRQATAWCTCLNSCRGELSLEPISDTLPKTDVRGPEFPEDDDDDDEQPKPKPASRPFGTVAIVFPIWVFLGCCILLYLGLEGFSVRWGPKGSTAPPHQTLAFLGVCVSFVSVFFHLFWVYWIVFLFYCLLERFGCYLFLAVFLFLNYFCLFLFVFVCFCFCWSVFYFVFDSFGVLLICSCSLCLLECFWFCFFLCVFFWGGGNIVFLAILVFIGLMLVQCLFLIFVSGFCFVYCFLFQDVPMLFVCVLSFVKTQGIFLIFASCFLFLFLVAILRFFQYCYLSKSNSPKRGIPNHPKMKNAQTRTISKNAVSAVLFTNSVLFFFWGGGPKK